MFPSNFSNVQVGSNGYVTFGNSYTRYDPYHTSGWNGPKMAAVLFSDVDLRVDSDSHLWYRETDEPRMVERVCETFSHNQSC